MKGTVLLGVTLKDEKLTPLIVYRGNSNGEIARNSVGMPASLKCVCQDKAWVDQRVFKHWILKIWAPFPLKKDNPT